MANTEHILPVAREFEDRDHHEWQISPSTGISQDYSNQLGTVLLWHSKGTLEAYEFTNKPIDRESMRESLLGYIERARSLPNYSEYMRERVDHHNSTQDVSKSYAVEDFVREENIEMVRELEQLAGEIRNAAQPQDSTIEANLTLVLEKTNAALEILYGEPKGLTPDECSYFVSLFGEYGINVR